MKTTLEIPDELYRAIKAKAAMEGRPVTQLVVEALRVAMPSAEQPVRRVQFPIIKSSRKGRKLTLEEVKKAQEDMEAEDLKRIVALMRR
ncbi:MAG: antitoxin [Acidobacteria bacterium]|nr:antitoxin [Acidobacteriota bacterium]